MIAFLVQAHGDPRQLDRLVRRLAPHDVFIHLDRKTEMSEAYRRVDAHFVEDRVPVYWAGYSQVEASTRLIEAALATGRRYDKLVLLSGACYPARSLAELAATFAADGGRNHIAYVAMRESAHLHTLIERRYFRDGLLPWRWTVRSRPFALAERALRKGLTTMLRPFLRRWPLGLEPFHGSQWWALTPEAAAHCVERIRHDPAIARTYRRVFAADEQVFHTLLGNSPFAGSCTGRIPFTGRGTWKAANLHLIHPSLGKWYDESDYDEIVASGRFFVRKVRTGPSDGLLDRLDMRIGA